MGFTGAFVLAAAGAEELEWLGGADGDESFPGGWTALVLSDEDVFWERDRVLAQLVEQTGRPALVALCLDSDFLGIVGRTPGGRTWDGVVDAESAAAARAEGLEAEYDVVVPVFAAPEEAVAGAVAWADAAGISPDEAALRRLFEVTEWEQPADQYWPALLAALRVESAPAPALSPAGRSPRPASRTKPLDQVVRDRIAPVLKELGFSRKGRKFTLERADGARAWTEVRAYRLGQHDAEFFVEFFVQPRVWRDMARAWHGHDSDWALVERPRALGGRTGPHERPVVLRPRRRDDRHGTHSRRDGPGRGRLDLPRSGSPARPRPVTSADSAPAGVGDARPSSPCCWRRSRDPRRSWRRC